MRRLAVIFAALLLPGVAAAQSPTPRASSGVHVAPIATTRHLPSPAPRRVPTPGPRHTGKPASSVRPNPNRPNRNPNAYNPYNQVPANMSADDVHRLLFTPSPAPTAPPTKRPAGGPDVFSDTSNQ